jgi:hypothetical protein
MMNNNVLYQNVTYNRSEPGKFALQAFSSEWSRRAQRHPLTVVRVPLWPIIQIFGLIPPGII